jgi:hypothetical protein
MNDLVSLCKRRSQKASPSPAAGYYTAMPSFDTARSLALHEPRVPRVVHESTARDIMADPKPDLPVKPISELVADPDFPNSAVGQRVDINGYSGVIVSVVKNSIKVRSAEGNTVSYNFHTLRRLYGPREEPVESPAEQAPPSPPVPQPQAKQKVILEPNFGSPLVPIESLVPRPDFPGCALGAHVDVHGFTGIVVELVGPSLKIRSREGATHSYNSDGLRKIYGLR